MQNYVTLVSLFVIGIVLGSGLQVQAGGFPEPDYYETSLYRNNVQIPNSLIIGLPFGSPIVEGSTYTVLLPDRKNLDVVYNESTSPMYRIYSITETTPGPFESFSPDQRIDDQSELFYLYEINIPTDKNDIFIIEIVDVDYGPDLLIYENTVINDFPRKRDHQYFVANVVEFENSFPIVTEISPKFIRFEQISSTNQITGIDYSVSFPESNYFKAEQNVPFTGIGSDLLLSGPVESRGSGIFTYTPQTPTGPLETKVVQLPVDEERLRGTFLRVLSPANGETIPPITGVRLPIQFELLVDPIYGVEGVEDSWHVSITALYEEDSEQFILMERERSIANFKFQLDNLRDTYVAEDELSLLVESGRDIKLVSKVTYQGEESEPTVSEFTIPESRLTPTNITSNTFMNDMLVPQYPLLNVRFDTNVDYEHITGRYSNNIPFEGELFDVDFEETFYNISSSRNRTVGFQVRYEMWTDENDFEFFAESADGLVDSFDISFSGEENLRPTFRQMVIENPEPLQVLENVSNPIDISGVFEGEFNNGSYQITRKMNVLLDEENNFLDSSGWQYERFGDVRLTSLLWQSDIVVETGYNKILIQPIDIRFPEVGYGNPATVTIQRLADPVEPSNMATLTEFSDIWFNEATPETSANDFENSVPYRTRFLGFFHDAPNGLKVLMEDVNDDGLEDAIHVTAFGEVWLAINDGAGSFEDPYRTNGYFLHDEFIGWKVLTGDLNKDSRADLIQITDLGQIWISYAEELEGGVIDYSLPEFVQNSPLRFDPENTDIFMADMTGDFRDDLVMIDNSDQGRMTLMEFQYTRFDDPVDLGLTGFSHTPSIGGRVMIADVTNDGFGDVVHVTGAGELWVAVSENLGTTLKDPVSWGNPGFRSISQPNDHWWTFITNGGPDDEPNFFCVNESGELWVSDLNYNETTQTGTASPPIFVQANGFRHQELGTWQTYFGNFVP